jgi:SAM-dependent methyltransferase
MIFGHLETIDVLPKIKSMIDLGAGDGRVVIYAAQHYGIQAIGLEINQELIKYGNLIIQKYNLSAKCQIIEADFYNYEITDFDLIYCFFLPTNQRYFKHVVETIKPLRYLISIRHPLIHFQTKLRLVDRFKPLEQFNVFLYQKVRNLIGV